jgi:hypothetical protein
MTASGAQTPLQEQDRTKGAAMGRPDLFRMPRKPWSAGRMIGAKAPLKPKHIWAVREHLKSAGAARDLAMFNVALDAKLLMQFAQKEKCASSASDR